MDLIQDLFKPILLLAVGAVGYFVRASYLDLKERLDGLTQEHLRIPERYITCSECDERTRVCQENRKDRQISCQEAIRDLRLMTSDLMGCVNKYIPQCEVKQR